MDKQIEEMAKVIENKCNRDCIPSCDECIAQTLYNAGYRKASDVAREIFAEIEDVLNNIGYFDEIDFKALKKKYESEGEKNGTDN